MELVTDTGHAVVPVRKGNHTLWYVIQDYVAYGFPLNMCFLPSSMPKGHKRESALKKCY